MTNCSTTSIPAIALVIVAAKRARQINNYHHQLGEGTFDQFLPPLVESRSKNYLTMSFEEISEGKIKYTLPEVAEAAARWRPSSAVLLRDLEVAVHLGFVVRAVEAPAAGLERHLDRLRAREGGTGEVFLELRLRRLLPLDREVVVRRAVA